MFIRVSLCCLLVASLSMKAHDVYANEGVGEMTATVFDPLLIDVKEAKRFCRENTHAVKCDILKERIKLEHEENKTLKKDRPRAHKIKSQISYNILLTSFE